MGMTNPILDIHFEILILGTTSKTCCINTDYIYYKERYGPSNRMILLDGCEAHTKVFKKERIYRK